MLFTCKCLFLVVADVISRESSADVPSASLESPEESVAECSMADGLDLRINVATHGTCQATMRVVLDPEPLLPDPLPESEPQPSSEEDMETPESPPVAGMGSLAFRVRRGLGLGGGQRLRSSGEQEDTAEGTEMAERQKSERYCFIPTPPSDLYGSLKQTRTLK